MNFFKKLFNRRPKSNYMIKFERELEIARRPLEEGDNLVIDHFEKEIRAILKKVAKQGHSGGSIHFYAEALSKAIKKAMLLQPLSPVTGDDDEWNDVSEEMGKISYQNNRCSAMFKEGRFGKPYYLDAIVFRGENGSQFTGNSVEMPDGSKLRSRQFVKFPFKPKSFYVDVIETEWHKEKDGTLTKQDGGGWWTSKIKDVSQLEEIAEYYDMKEQVPFRKKKDETKD